MDIASLAVLMMLSSAACGVFLWFVKVVLTNAVRDAIEAIENEKDYSSDSSTDSSDYSDSSTDSSDYSETNTDSTCCQTPSDYTDSVGSDYDDEDDSTNSSYHENIPELVGATYLQTDDGESTAMEFEMRVDDDLQGTTYSTHLAFLENIVDIIVIPHENQEEIRIRLMDLNEIHFLAPPMTYATLLNYLLPEPVTATEIPLMGGNRYIDSDEASVE